MKELFLQYPALILFLHVLSAVIWIGGMIAIRFSVHYSMKNIQEPYVRLERVLEILKIFFNIVAPCILILLGTALILIFGLELKNTPMYQFVHIKEAIWTIMTIIYIMAYMRRNRAQKEFLDGNLDVAKMYLSSIANIFVPLNIILGLVAIYLGITIRGF